MYRNCPRARDCHRDAVETIVEYRESLRKLIEERIKRRKALIENLDTCIKLNEKYRIPWTGSYTYDQKVQEELAMAEEVRLLAAGPKSETADGPETERAAVDENQAAVVLVQTDVSA